MPLTKATIDDKLMMQPRDCLSAGTKACVTLNNPCRLTSMIRSQTCVASGSSMRARPEMPALLMSTSMGPNRSASAVASAATAPRSVTSTECAQPAPLLRPMSSAIAQAAATAGDQNEFVLDEVHAITPKTQTFRYPDRPGARQDRSRACPKGLAGS